ncbi:hypothetical protein ES703_21508 [subsurface metagenome]
MPKIKITVIKRFSPEDVFGHEYKTPTGKVVEKCSFEDGQEWISENREMPEGFCWWAWTDLTRTINVLRLVVILNIGQKKVRRMIHVVTE